MVRRRWAAVAAVAVTVLALSLVTPPGRATTVAVPFADKAAHALGYGVLGVVVVRAISADSRILARLAPATPRGSTDATVPIVVSVVAVLVVVAYGGGVELLQMSVSGRSAGVADGLANAVGTVAAVGGWTVRVRRHAAGIHLVSRNGPRD